MTVVPNDNDAMIQEQFQNGSMDQCEENKKSEVEAEIVIGVDKLENGLFPKPEGETLLSPTETKSRQANVNVNDKEEAEDMFELEKDIYSIMYIAAIKSRCLWWSLLVCATQLLILSLAITDMIKDAPDNNRFKLPIDVNSQVAVAQFVSTVVITLMQNDVFTSLDALIVVGYHASVAEQFPGATMAKWIISNLLRMLVGLVNLVAAFFIIVQADNVLDIFKDFAALHFITELDNVAFWLADLGYLGESMNSAANNTKSIRLPHSRRTMKWLVWSAITVIVVVMLSGFGRVRSRQMKGYYLKRRSAHSLTVSFGDEVYKLPEDNEFNFDNATRDIEYFKRTSPPDLHYAYFSGEYQQSSDGDKPDLYNGRPRYYERNAAMCKKDPTCGMFYYCSYVGAWVFTIRALNNATQQLGPDKCEWGWLALSAKTDAYKLEDVPTTGWKIWTGVIKETDTLAIISDACHGPEDCSFHGICEQGICACRGDWEGKKCDIYSDCPALLLIKYGESSFEYEQSDPFFLLTDEEGAATTAYGRPIYVKLTKDICGNQSGLEAVLYTGRRWFDAFWCNNGYLDENGTITDEGKEFFGSDLHAYWDDVQDNNALLFSEASTSESPSGLALFDNILSRGSKGEYALAKKTFECMDVACQRDRSVCGYYNECIPQTYDDGKNTFSFHNCSCLDYFGGVFCQFAPNGAYVKEQYEAFNEALNQAPNEAYKDTLEKALNETLDDALNETLNEALNETLNEALNETSNVTFDETFDETNDEAYFKARNAWEKVYIKALEEMIHSGIGSYIPNEYHNLSGRNLFKMKSIITTQPLCGKICEVAAHRFSSDLYNEYILHSANRSLGFSVSSENDKA